MGGVGLVAGGIVGSGLSGAAGVGNVAISGTTTLIDGTGKGVGLVAGGIRGSVIKGVDQINLTTQTVGLGNTGTSSDNKSENTAKGKGIRHSLNLRKSKKKIMSALPSFHKSWVMTS